jgi:hypothetical protein
MERESLWSRLGLLCEFRVKLKRLRFTDEKVIDSLISQTVLI